MSPAFQYRLRRPRRWSASRTTGGPRGAHFRRWSGPTSTAEPKTNAPCGQPGRLRELACCGNGFWPDTRKSIWPSVSLARRWRCRSCLAPTGSDRPGALVGRTGAARAAERAGHPADAQSPHRRIRSRKWPREPSTTTGFSSIRGVTAARPVRRSWTRCSTAPRTPDYRTLVITVDVPVQGNRTGERRTGMGHPPILTPRRIADAAIRPRWWYGLLRHRRMTMRNVTTVRGRGRAPSNRSQSKVSQMRPDLTWQ